MACSAHNGGISQRIQRGAPGHASSAPSRVPIPNDSSVVVPRSPTVHGTASPTISRTVRG